MVEKPVEALPRGLRDSAVEGNGSGDAAAGIESILAEVLADVVSTEQVPVDGHFFEELGADSLVMAHFCARVRKRADLPSVSMKDVYRHPTIRSLAAALADTEPTPAPVKSPTPAPAPAPPVEEAKRAGTREYVLCGTLQVLFFLGYCSLAALVTAWGYQWASAGSDVVDIYLRAVLFSGATLVFLCTLPILVKWVLVGRWKPRQIRIWSLAYVRFWIVKTLVRSNPLVLFTGSPLYPLYLRALGAKVGRRVLILSPHVPVCADLLTIGDGTVIRKESFFNCYRAHDGQIQTGRVTFGKDVFVAEGTVIDIEASMGDGAQLGHASSLHTGQAVPHGERWHGSPARRTDVDFRRIGPAHCPTLQRGTYTIWQLLRLLFLYGPLAYTLMVVLLREVPSLKALLTTGQQASFTRWRFYTDALTSSFVLYFGAVLFGLIVVATVPRVVNLAIKPDRVYPLYGFHYGVQRMITRMTNVKILSNLFGDSVYIVHYLRAIGYDLGKVVQTGSNFGGNVAQDNPHLCSVGSGTMVADALIMMNADYSSTSFKVSRASIGARNFLGNGIHVPVGGRTGDNCLLATKVHVPIDGKVRENVGLLGSPPFEIPRSVERDSSFDHLKSGDELRRGLAAKTRHNTVSIGLSLLVRWLFVFVLFLAAGIAADVYEHFGTWTIGLYFVLSVLFGVVYWVLIERIVTGFKTLPVLFCSIYEPAMWRHERYWKVASIAYLTAFAGTPFINLILRLLGARIGRRVFNDGCGMPERSLVTVGDDCTLNEKSAVQCHSQEDATFKSDHSTLGDRVTLGIGAHIHYAVTIGDDAVLAPDCFLMKGEEVPPRALWGGNPARETRGAELRGGNRGELPSAAHSTVAKVNGTVAKVSGGKTR